MDPDLLLAAMEPLEFAAHSHLIAQAELKQDRLSKSDLFELRKVKAHLMGWLVQLKSLLRRAATTEARLLIDALDATALMLHRADLLIMWGHINGAPPASTFWGCPERQGKVCKMDQSSISSNMQADMDDEDTGRYLFLFPGRLAICRRRDRQSGYEFVKHVEFGNTQISRGYAGNPSAFELINHDAGRLERVAFQCTSIAQCEMWCKDIETELRRAMLAQFTKPGNN